MPLSLDDFDYDCPPELIAQHAAEARDGSRLLHLDRATGRVSHEWFRDLPSKLDRGDALVLNTSRVIRARLRGTRQNGRPAEVLLVHPDVHDTWIAMVHPGGKLKRGRTVQFVDGATVEIIDILGGGLRRVALSGPLDWRSLMDRCGDVPLPPYIERMPEDADRERYQTVFARHDGSVAAPTAGLHFTRDTLNAISKVGGAIVEIVLHVGPGTFKPVRVADITQHRMHAEWYSVDRTAAQCLTEIRRNGGRIWAVGTTVARVLETVTDGDTIEARAGWTDLFIYPGYTFRTVDALITNFHLPRSTLLMLVSAFGGRELVMRAYREAVDRRYRLYSYGDAMLIT